MELRPIMPNAAALDAMATRIEVLELAIAAEKEAREADNARWKEIVDQLQAERLEHNRIERLRHLREVEAE